MLIECFPFFNELDLLELRLNITDSYVDYWVISESRKTFSGLDKPLYLKDNLDTRYSKFKDKIIHVEYNCCGDAWHSEFESRNALGRTILSKFNDKDVVVLSDCDEIPDYRKITFKEELPTIIETKGYYYYLNCRQNLDFQVVSMFNVSILRDIAMNRLRACAGKAKVVIKDAGWHWSFLGGADKIKEKIDAYAHQEMNLPEINNVSSIEANVDGLKDIFGRKELSYSIVSIDDSYPDYLLNNLDKYRHLVLNK